MYLSSKINSMKKQVLILSRRDERANYDTALSMTKKLNEYNNKEVEYSASFLEDLCFYFDGQELKVTDTLNDRDLIFYDACFVIGWFKSRKLEDLALSVGIYLKSHGKKVLNSEVLSNRSRSKLSQLVYASLNGVKTTEFLAINEVEQLESFLAKTKLKYPFIAKSASASRGDNNYLVKNYEELHEIIKSLPTKIVLLQEFIPNQGDLRVIVMGEEVKLVIKRTSINDSHLNNTSQGGKAEIVSIEEQDKSMLEQSVVISKLLGREITGVDMIQHQETGEYYMLEVNNMPQLSTGSFVDEKAKVLSSYLASWASDI